MGRVFINKTLIFFQILAVFLLFMLILYIFVISDRVLFQICLVSSCVGPIYFIVLMVYVGGTFLSPIKIEVFDNSVTFIHFVKARTKSIPFNRIKEINPSGKEKRNQIMIVDKHGEEHRFYMIGPKISKEIIDRFEKFKEEGSDDQPSHDGSSRSALLE